MSAMKKSKKHHEEEGGEAWLLPYSDLMTLLLAVFIVLFAVSKVDESKAKDMAAAFKESMVGSEGVLSNTGHSVIEHPDTSIDSIPEVNVTDSNNSTSGSQGESDGSLGKAEMEDLKNLEEQIDQQLKDEGLTDVVSTGIDSRGLVISLNNAILFDSGSADIKPENEDVLINIAKTINELDKNKHIRIEGHTDNRPIHTAIYPSNWELSSARASRVVRLFIDKCNVSPDKVVAVGYGEYKPVANNATEKGREKNRRIDIIVLGEKYNNLEEQGGN